MAQADPDNPLQGYYDWQITTLMLAYDLVDPIPASEVDGDNEDAVHDRRERVEQEVRELSLQQVPPEYQTDETLDWPPTILANITRATFRRAVEIIQTGTAGDTTV